MDKVDGIQIEIGAKTLKFDNAITGIRQGLATLNDEAKDLNKNLEIDPHNLNTIEKSIKNNTQKTALLNNEIKKYKEQQSSLEGEAWAKIERKINKAKREVEKTNKNVEKLTSLQNDIKNDKSMLNFAKKTEKLNDKLKESSQNLENINKELKLDPSNIETLKKKFKRLDSTIETSKQKISLLNEQLKHADASSYSKIESELIDAKLELQNLTSESRKTQLAFKDLTNESTKDLQGLTSEVKDLDVKIKDLNNDLKLDPGNIEKITSKSELLGSKIEKLSQKSAILKQQLKNANESDFENLKHALQSVNDEMVETSLQLGTIKKEFNSLESENIDIGLLKNTLVGLRQDKTRIESEIENLAEKIESELDPKNKQLLKNQLNSLTKELPTVIGKIAEYGDAFDKANKNIKNDIQSLNREINGFEKTTSSSLNKIEKDIDDSLNLKQKKGFLTSAIESDEQALKKYNNILQNLQKLKNTANSPIEMKQADDSINKTIESIKRLESRLESSKQQIIEVDHKLEKTFDNIDEKEKDIKIDIDVKSDIKESINKINDQLDSIKKISLLGVGFDIGKTLTAGLNNALSGTGSLLRGSLGKSIDHLKNINTDGGIADLNDNITTLRQNLLNLDNLKSSPEVNVDFNDSFEKIKSLTSSLSEISTKAISIGTLGSINLDGLKSGVSLSNNIAANLSGASLPKLGNISIPGIPSNLLNGFTGKLSLNPAPALSTLKNLKSTIAQSNFVAEFAFEGVQEASEYVREYSSKIFEASDAVDKFKDTMKFAEVSDSEIPKITENMVEYADKTVYSLGDVLGLTSKLASNGVKNYQRLVVAAGNLNAIAGGTAETFKTVGQVITQTSGTGKLTAENWNQLTDAIPGASGKIKELIAEMGEFDVKNFQASMAKGKISSEMFNDALTELGMSTAAVEASSKIKTFESAFGDLEVQVIDAGKAIVNEFGKQNLLDVIKNLGERVKSVKDVILNLMSFYKDNKSIIDPALKLLYEFGLTFASIAITIGAVGAALNAALNPMIAFAGALSLAIMAYKDTAGGKSSINGFNNWVKNEIPNMIKSTTEFINSFKFEILDLFIVAWRTFNKLFNYLKSIMPTIKQVFTISLISVLSVARQAIELFGDALKILIKIILTSVNILNELFTRIKTFIQPFTEDIKKFVLAFLSVQGIAIVLSTLVGVISTVLTPLNLLAAAIAAVYTSYSGTAEGQKYVSQFKQWLGVQLPNLINNVMKILYYFKNYLTQFLSFVNNIINMIINKVGTGYNTLQNIFKSLLNVFNSFKNFIQPFTEDIKKFVLVFVGVQGIAIILSTLVGAITAVLTPLNLLAIAIAAVYTSYSGTAEGQANIKRFKNWLDIELPNIANKSTQALKSLQNQLQLVLNYINNFINYFVKNKDFLIPIIGNFVKITASVLAFNAAVGLLSPVLGPVLTIFKGLLPIIPALLSPLGLLTGAIIGIGAAFASSTQGKQSINHFKNWLDKELPNILNKGKNTLNEFKNKLNETFDKMGASFARFIKFYEQNKESINGIFGSLGSSLKGLSFKVLDGIAFSFDIFLKSLQSLITFYIKNKENISNFTSTIKNFIFSLFNNVKGAGTIIFSSIQTAIGNLIDYYKENKTEFDEMFTKIKGFFSNTLKSAIKGISDGIIILSNAFKQLMDFYFKNKDVIDPIVTKIAQLSLAFIAIASLKNKLDPVIGAISKLYDNLKPFLSIGSKGVKTGGIFGPLGAILGIAFLSTPTGKQAMDDLKKFIFEDIPAIWDKMKKMFNKGTDKAENLGVFKLFNSLWTLFKTFSDIAYNDIFKGLLKTIGNLVSAFIPLFKGTGNTKQAKKNISSLIELIDWVNKVSKQWRKGFNTSLDFINKFLKGFKKFNSEIADVIKRSDGRKGLLWAIGEVLGKKGNKLLKKLFTKIKLLVLSQIDKIKNKLLIKLAEVSTKIKNFFSFGAIIQNISSLLNTRIIDPIKNIPGKIGASLSKFLVFGQDIGSNIIIGMTNFIKSAGQLLSDALHAPLDFILNGSFFSEMFEKFKTFYDDVFTVLKRIFEEIADVFVKASTSIFDRIIIAFDNFVEGLKSTLNAILGFVGLDFLDGGNPNGETAKSLTSRYQQKTGLKSAIGGFADQGILNKVWSAMTGALTRAITPNMGVLSGVGGGSGYDTGAMNNFLKSVNKSGLSGPISLDTGRVYNKSSVINTTSSQTINPSFNITVNSASPNGEDIAEMVTNKIVRQLNF